mmetsp:Transcript_16024/g.41503  ORF Transcript_16024/g.41503 Transcript_16024/m.41503 type:complete len:259 (-) Transcript_16024:3402-4178(-)
MLVEAQTTYPDVRPLRIPPPPVAPPLEGRRHRHHPVAPCVAQQRVGTPHVVLLSQGVHVRTALFAVSRAHTMAASRFRDHLNGVQNCGVLRSVRFLDLRVSPVVLLYSRKYFGAQYVYHVMHARSKEVTVIEVPLPRRLSHVAETLLSSHVGHVALRRDRTKIDKYVAQVAKARPILGDRVPAWLHDGFIDFQAATFRAVHNVPTLDLLRHFGKRGKFRVRCLPSAHYFKDENAIGPYIRSLRVLGLPEDFDRRPSYR